MAQRKDNMQKYANYKEQMKRLKMALEYKFYLEAVFIEYAIMEDRLESALRHSGKWDPKPGQHISIDRKIKLLLKQAEAKKNLAQKYFQPELMQSLFEWKERRNPLMHSLMKQSLHTEDLANLAMEGQTLVKQLSGKVRLFNAAMERRNNKQQEATHV